MWIAEVLKIECHWRIWAWTLLLQDILDILFIYFLKFILVFRDRVSLCSPGCPGTHSVDKAGLELRNLPAFASASSSASASQVLRLKACATTAWCLFTFQRLFPFLFSPPKVPYPFPYPCWPTHSLLFPWSVIPPTHTHTGTLSLHRIQHLSSHWCPTSI